MNPRAHVNEAAHGAYVLVRRFVVFVVGISILAIGLVMAIAPGPAIVVVPLGLAVLAVEFAWARRLLKRLRAEAIDAADKVGGKKAADGMRWLTRIRAGGDATEEGEPEAVRMEEQDPRERSPTRDARATE